MNTESLESRLQEITYWCRLIHAEPEKKEAISYLYVHTQLLLDELKNKKYSEQKNEVLE
ncbi:hypothetical protein [Vibrio sp. Isolate24]|uniref:hypothetical protein n=1 Tax=Vibrio sp. Isolate24 TaxID=2908534 RepID=UPI001EFC32BF|nr:hypothetical protein [Vibrio sp. Isolate24]MCG9677613.1 hypothetical protein [Vibrio sp. Isolate24]